MKLPVVSLRRLAPSIVLAVLAAFSGGCSPRSLQRSTVDAGVPLHLTDVDGETHDVDAALSRGDTVALVFWQPGCQACAREAPELNRAVEEHDGEIRFLGVVPGEDVTDEQLRDTAVKFGYRFPQARDVDQSLCDALEVVATPTLLVLGTGREVRYRGHRLPGDWGALSQSH